jgi:hypothetical protein
MNSNKLHKMKLGLLSIVAITAFGLCDQTNRKPLSYAAVPDGTYVSPKSSNITTLLDFVKSRSDLTTLAGVIEECAGMSRSVSHRPRRDGKLIRI